MKKTSIIIILIILIIVLAIGIFIANKNLTGNIIKEQEDNSKSIHTYTKAICNSSNYCQDYEIICENNQTKSINPITGAVIQFDEEWKDPRAEEEIERLC